MTYEQGKLLACWRKKSIDVTAKLVLYAACVIDTLAVGIITFLASVWTYENFYSPTVGLFTGFASRVLLIVAFVPWYVWLGVGVIVAILVYSYAWCVAREFTDEDWACENTFVSVSVIGISGGIVSIVLAYATSVFIIIYLGGQADGLLVGTIGLWFIYVFILLGIGMSLVGCKWIWVSDVYLHYRKRIKGGKK